MVINRIFIKYPLYEYDAFGNFLTKAENIPNRFCFTGEQYDPLTSQYYLRARFYNPIRVRFLNEDTYYGDGLNLYAYCHNNPVKYVDPSGHDQICAKKYHELKNAGYSSQEAYMLAKAEYLNRNLGAEAAKNYLDGQINKKGLSGS